MPLTPCTDDAELTTLPCTREGLEAPGTWTCSLHDTNLFGATHCFIASPMASVADKSSQTAADCLSAFIDDVGIPQVLWTDGVKEHQGCNTAFRKVCNKCWIDLRMTEPGQKNQNHTAEREIGELKKQWHHWMA